MKHNHPRITSMTSFLYLMQASLLSISPVRQCRRYFSFRNHFMNSRKTLLRAVSWSIYSCRALGPVKFFFCPRMWATNSAFSTEYLSQIWASLSPQVSFWIILMVFWQMLKQTFLVTILGATLSFRGAGSASISTGVKMGSGSATDRRGSKGMKTGSAPKASESFLTGASSACSSWVLGVDSYWKYSLRSRQWLDDQGKQRYQLKKGSLLNVLMGLHIFTTFLLGSKYYIKEFNFNYQTDHY